MANHLQAGQTLGKYRLIQQLGSGGFAEVFLGEHQYLKHRVAIKVLTISLNQKEADRFLQEARTMAALKHSHIVGCSDFDIEQGVPFLVMDFVPGGTLRDRYPEGTRAALSDVVNSVSQVAEALQYAHDQGVIHLDVKPENMLLSANGNVLLADFGIARFNYSVSQKLTSLMGTVAYMAPEFLQSRPRPASDQYALAMVAYEWLVGSCAFTGISGQAVALQHMTIPPPSLRDHDTAIMVTVDQVILKALSKGPEDRYPSVSSFAQALAQASTTDTNQHPTTPHKAGLQARQLRLKTPYTRNWGQPLGQGDAATAKTDHQAQMQIQQGKPDQHEDTLDQSEQRKRFRMEAFGPQLHHQWIVSLVWGIFLVGVDTTVGALTQSWLIALLALAITGTGGYFLGYRKALGPIPLAIPSAVSLILTLALTLMLAPLNYAQPISVPYATWYDLSIITSHVSFIGRQLTCGLICGSMTALATVITAMIVRPPWSKQRPAWSATWQKAGNVRQHRKNTASTHLTVMHLIWIFLSTYAAGVGLTAAIALIAAMSNFGFGWDPNAYVMELAFLMASFLIIGIGSSIPIWWTAITPSRLETR